VLRRADAAARSETARCFEIALTAIEKITIQRKNYVGAIQFRQYPCVGAETCLHRDVCFLTKARLVNAPTHSGKFFLQFCSEALSRRRIRLLDQKRKTAALIIQDGFARFSEELLKFFPRARLAFLDKTFRTGRVVKIENRRLNERVRSTSACRVQRIPFKL